MSSCLRRFLFDSSAFFAPPPTGRRRHSGWFVLVLRPEEVNLCLFFGPSLKYPFSSFFLLKHLPHYIAVLDHVFNHAPLVLLCRWLFLRRIGRLRRAWAVSLHKKVLAATTRCVLSLLHFYFLFFSLSIDLHHRRLFFSYFLLSRRVP